MADNITDPNLTIHNTNAQNIPLPQKVSLKSKINAHVQNIHQRFAEKTASLKSSLTGDGPNSLSHLKGKLAQNVTDAVKSRISGETSEDTPDNTKATGIKGKLEQVTAKAQTAVKSAVKTTLQEHFKAPTEPDATLSDTIVESSPPVPDKGSKKSLPSQLFSNLQSSFKQEFSGKSKDDKLGEPAEPDAIKQLTSKLQTSVTTTIKQHYSKQAENPAAIALDTAGSINQPSLPSKIFHAVKSTLNDEFADTPEAEGSAAAAAALESISPPKKSIAPAKLVDTVKSTLKKQLGGVKIQALDTSNIAIAEDSTSKVLDQGTKKLQTILDDGKINAYLQETGLSLESIHNLEEKQIHKILQYIYPNMFIELIDPPAAATAMAANLRYKSRLLRLEEQQLLRTTLREEFSTVYQVQTDIIEEMKIKLQAEKLL